MNSVSQWNETGSACELLPSKVSVYTPAVSTTDTKGGGGGGGGRGDRPREGIPLGGGGGGGWWC